MDQQTKGKNVKNPSSYRNYYKGKITDIDQPINNRCSFIGRETEILQRIKTLEQCRAEMIQTKFENHVD